jgi:GH43 family beta-xylosidase
VETAYTNPVYRLPLADPFVLKHDGHYYAYGTAPGAKDGAQFPVLRSPDLVNWELASYALRPSAGDEFWAPEVAYFDGEFYMYYSARGVDRRDHQLRVAVSDHPAGPYVEREGVLVADQPFTIDAHPFFDGDGEWYLFYAQDFLTPDDDHRIGTGIVVDRLIDMTRLAGDPRVVVRPHADWHLFQAQRAIYGQTIDWHTVEGPALMRHKARYYCFFSGGAWKSDNYGVSYVVADHPLGPYSRPETPDPRILKTDPGALIGPGHNSFTTSPDGSETFIVYHAWDPDRTARRMCVDRFLWEDDLPVVVGPTSTPQPLPK